MVCSPQKNVVLFIMIGALQVSSYKLHTALNSIVFTNVVTSDDDVQTEYYFGVCGTRNKALVNHQRLKYEDIVGALVVRGWLSNVTAKPTCVYVTGKSTFDNSVNYRAYKFNMCIGYIYYIHAHELWKYYFYEWYVPVQMLKGIEWDLYFYK